MSASCPRVFMDVGATQWLGAHAAPRRALFLDRDGVINVNHGYVHTTAHTDFVPGIFVLVAAAYAAGLEPIVVTNQAGIARGLYSESEFEEYTRWLHGEFAKRRTPLLATYYCPHHPVAGLGEYRLDCGCRKPAPGMLLRAKEDLRLDLARSFLIGDQDSDIAAGQAAGVGHCFKASHGNLEAAVGWMRINLIPEIEENHEHL